MAFFVGEYKQTIDAKHRTVIPMGLREGIVPEEDGPHFILILAPERHLWLYPNLWYQRLLAKLRPSPLPDRTSRKRRLLFASARLVKPDKQGRIVLPEESMQRAKISQAVTLVGDFDHIEIWPREEWERDVQARLPLYEEVMYEVADELRNELLTSETEDTT